MTKMFRIHVYILLFFFFAGARAPEFLNGRRTFSTYRVYTILRAYYLRVRRNICAPPFLSVCYLFFITIHVPCFYCFVRIRRAVHYSLWRNDHGYGRRQRQHAVSGRWGTYPEGLVLKSRRLPTVP